MSQFPATPARSELSPTSNSLGFAGFLCSVIGLACTVGILCPIGLVLSLIGLRKEPRGFAIAGAIIGFLGTIGMVLAIALGLFAFLLAAAGIATAAAALEASAPYVRSVADGASLYHQVELYKQSKGSLPGSIEALEVDPSAIIDGWGNKYRYQLNPDGSFTILSDGPDGKKGTIDDISVTSSNPEEHQSRHKKNNGAV